ncbi:hypothetical protein X777_06667 [Ooceraea biroi]|uniref:Uncharacterized protein n=1 Tax=Ooceraea biroi TaxID=2015173 RepID=A0A026WDL0_OOCBI|nr:hypothetical protein X777_06667 [Ooceraea biroi]
MDDRLNLVSNKMSIEIPHEPTESIIEVMENESNLSSSRLNCDIDWKKQYETFNELYEKREKTYHDVLKKYNKCNILKEKVKKLNAEKISLHKQCVNNRKSQSIIKNIFNDDQIRALVNKSNQGSKWSEKTIKKALRLKFSCGLNGYNELLGQRMPLPSVRTLQEKLETPL